MAGIRPRPLPSWTNPRVVLECTGENTTYSALAAAGMTQVVLFLYVVVAVLEDRNDDSAVVEAKKKD
jgi:hypothetical protein